MGLPSGVAGFQRRNDGAEGGDVEVGGRKEAEWKHISYGRDVSPPTPPPV